MKRIVVFVLVIAAAVGAVLGIQMMGNGSGDEGVSERGPETAQRTTGNTPFVRPDYYPKANPYGGLASNVLDTLRAMKDEYEITRDEYWKETGGVLASRYLEVWYPPGRTSVTHGMRVFMEMMPARDRFVEIFGQGPEDPLIIYCMAELDVFNAVTGREWWHYSHINEDTMSVQPIYHLHKRGIINVALAHEYYHWAITKTSRQGAPRWLEEGLASYLAGEHLLLEVQMYEFPERNEKYPLAEIESILEAETERKSTRRAYYYSWRMVKNLVDHYGEDKVRDVVLELGRGRTLNEACQKAFNEPYDTVMAVAIDYTLDLQPN